MAAFSRNGKFNDTAPASTSSLFRKAVNLNVVAVLLVSAQHEVEGQAEQD